MKSPTVSPKDDYEVITGFWDCGQFRSQGETLRMSEEQARTHLLAGCLRKKAVQSAFETPSNAG